MINRKHRFQGPRALNFVYKNGRMTRGPNFGVKAAHNPQRTSYRAAVVISRKVHKSAVARNRMRRRIYSVLRGLGDQIDGPQDIVITVFNDGVMSAEPKEIASQLKKQLQALKLIK